MAALNISLADLRQDIAGAIPLDLVLRWSESDKSELSQAKLLAPHRVRGTIVSTDSAGLSKLSQQLTLPQVMKLISEPKEIIYSLGTAIGGKAVGIWAADNTQMFYPDSISPAEVLNQMAGAQHAAHELTVKVGMGIHHGECYLLAGGLFGEEAEYIEALAEDETAGGEIILSESLKNFLSSHVSSMLTLREDLLARGKIWSLQSRFAEFSYTPRHDPNYPAPFDREFLNILRDSSLLELKSLAFSTHSKIKTVGFIKIPKRAHHLLLENFTDLSLIEVAIRKVVASYRAELIKSNGSLAIILFDGSDEAVSCTNDLHETLAAMGFNARTGIVHGEVFLFPMADGAQEIAGNPVNIGSKLSEDSGLDGILIEESAAATLTNHNGMVPFALTISRVLIRGLQYQSTKR